MLYVAFGHKRRRGKDTAAKFLNTYLRINCPGISVRRASFAWKLKDIAYQLYAWAGLQEPEYYDLFPHKKEEILPELSKSPRQIWIDLGTKAIRRNVYEHTWVDYVLKTPNEVDVILLSDVRFLDEASRIKECGGFVIRVDRDIDEPVLDDAGSETGLDNYTDWDLIIDNNGTLNDLNYQIERIGDQLISMMQHRKRIPLEVTWEQ